MRLKLGRPDLSTYADRFTVPEATAGGLSVTFLGVSTLLIRDDESALLTDGFFSRPGLLTVGFRKVAPDLARITESLRRAEITRLDAVVPVHSHFDHVMDSPTVAELTGARLFGGESTANVGLGHGMVEESIVRVGTGHTETVGSFDLTWFASEHCPPDRYPGVIAEPIRPASKVTAYKCGEAWSILVRHRSTDRTILVQGSAGFRAGALEGISADVVYLGIGQLGIQEPEYIEQYWTHIVRASGAKEVVLTHWDDFFQPLSKPLRSLPSAGDDLDVTMRELDYLAKTDDVRVRFPTVWVPEDPFSA